MGQVVTRVEAAVQRKRKEVEIRRQRRQDRGLPGIPKLLTDSYVVGAEIHEGAHGRIYIVSKGTSKQPLVMKALRKDQRSYGLLDVRQHALAIEELQSCRLRHENICSYYGIFESSDLLCVVMESCDGGSARNYLQERLHLDDYATAKIMKQTLDGLSYLHSKQIVHRDLRPEQLLFTSLRRKRLKISDLLHSAQAMNGRKIVDQTKPSFLLFSAPESLTTGEYSKMSDMWSVGCCLYELLYGHPPFTGENKPLARRIVEDEPDFSPLFSECSQSSVALLGLLLSKQARSRPSANEALAHEWFRKAQDIGQAQARAAAVRVTAREAMLQQLQTMQLKRERRKAAEESEEAQSLQSQFSRSLTDSYSHLSCSTPSSAEVEEDEENVKYKGAVSPWAALRDDDGERKKGGSDESGSDDWRCDPDRSDLESGPPPSGGEDSHSGTYVNSETAEYFARTKGHWDEFDSEFFEEDRQLSSCWSEAEFSDWTVDEPLRKEHDREFKEWFGPEPTSTQEQGGRPAKAQAQAQAQGQPSSSPQSARSPSQRSGGSHHSGAQPAPRATQSRQPREEPPADGGDAPAMDAMSLRSPDRLGLGRSDLAVATVEHEDSRSSRGFGTQRDGSLHAADELELAARDRSEGTAASRSSQSLSQATSQSSSAPWEFTERSNASSNSSSMVGGAAPGRSRDVRDKAAAHRGMQEPSLAQLATISEKAELTETLGDVTRRSLAELSGTAGDSTSGNFIVMSRRSNSSSSSARDAAR